MLKLRIENLDEETQRMASAPDNISDATDAVIGDWVRSLRAFFTNKRYPPKRPRQKHIRTYRLKSSYRASRFRRGAWMLQNTAPYASYVVADAHGAGQAWMHAGRWWTLRGEIDQKLPDLSKRIGYEAVKVVNRGR